MSDIYDNVENKELLKTLEDKIIHMNNLQKYKSKLTNLLDVLDYERNDDGTIKLDDREQKIPKWIPPMDRDIESTITPERRNKLWIEYKVKTEELLSEFKE